MGGRQRRGRRLIVAALTVTVLAGSVACGTAGAVNDESDPERIGALPALDQASIDEGPGSDEPAVQLGGPELDETPVLDLGDLGPGDELVVRIPVSATRVDAAGDGILAARVGTDRRPITRLSEREWSGGVANGVWLLARRPPPAARATEPSASCDPAAHVPLAPSDEAHALIRSWLDANAPAHLASAYAPCLDLDEIQAQAPPPLGGYGYEDAIVLAQVVQAMAAACGVTLTVQVGTDTVTLVES